MSFEAIQGVTRPIETKGIYDQIQGVGNHSTSSRHNILSYCHSKLVENIS